MREITIAGRKVGDGYPPLITAEVGVNHNGDLDRALAMVTAAKEAGCDAIKFATLKAAEFCNPAHMISYHYKGELITESELSMFRRCELPDDAWRTIKDECDRHGIIFFSTPQNESDLKLLLDVGVPAIKIGSDDLTNTALIESYAQHGLPIILSSGMADMADIDQALHTVDNVPVLLCVCTSEYPTPAENANVARVRTLRAEYRDVPIGFSDHTEGHEAALVASALGACYFEKHFTIDPTLQGPDHEFAASTIELGWWAQAIKDARILLGHGRVEPTEQERANRANWRRKSGQQIRGQVDAYIAEALKSFPNG